MNIMHAFTIAMILLVAIAILTFIPRRKRNWPTVKNCEFGFKINEPQE